MIREVSFAAMKTMCAFAVSARAAAAATALYYYPCRYRTGPN
jgi:hypothetical protein